MRASSSEALDINSLHSVLTPRASLRRSNSTKRAYEGLFFIKVARLFVILIFASLIDGITLNPNYVETSTNAPEYTAQTFTVSAINTSSYTNSKTNDWKLYTFYIKSNVHFDSELNLEIWLEIGRASCRERV